MQLQRKVKVRRSPIHGKGLFAVKRIRKGELIGTFEGVPTSRDGTHVLWVETEDGDFAGLRGTNYMRFGNHSRTPNAEYDGIKLYALRGIPVGTEITHDYGDEWSDIE